MLQAIHHYTNSYLPTIPHFFTKELAYSALRDTAIHATKITGLIGTAYLVYQIPGVSPYFSSAITTAGATGITVGMIYLRKKGFTVAESARILPAIIYSFFAGPPSLHSPILHEQPFQARCYLLCGANVHSSTITEKSFFPIHLAAQFDSPTMTALLLEHGADIEQKDENGDTPIFTAIWHLSQSATNVLIDKGAQINIKNHMGDTPLHLACKKNAFSIVIALIEKGADLTVKNAEGRTPLQHLLRYFDLTDEELHALDEALRQQVFLLTQEQRLAFTKSVELPPEILVKIERRLLKAVTKEIVENLGFS